MSAKPQSPLPAFDFLALGEAMVDFISINLANSLRDADHFERFVGGQVTNLAMNMAKLGNSVALGACVGQDGLGQFVRDQVKKTGVSTAFIQSSRQAPTTTAAITRQTQTPDFIIHRGADAFMIPSIELTEAVTTSKVIHTSAFALSREPARTTILSAIRLAKEKNALVTLDPNYHPEIWPDSPNYVDALKAAFEFVDIAKPSLDDCTRIFGPRNTPEEYAHLFLDLGTKTVLISMGAQGVFLATSEGDQYHIHANPNAEIVDVTGAGDAFWAGFLHVYMEGASPLEAACMGQIFAEVKIGQIGPIKQVPDWELLRQSAARVPFDTPAASNRKVKELERKEVS